MSRKNWYLIAYDIADSKRLQRVHRFLKTKAWMLQKSVYLCQISNTDLATLQVELRKLTNAGEDDIRAYPVQPPGKHWTSGCQADALTGAYGAASTDAIGIGKRLVRAIVVKLGGNK